MLKSFPKILTILFLTIFIFQLACLLFLTLIPNAGQAADIKFTPQVQGLDYTFNSSDKTTGNIANYVRAIYKYAIGIVGILAAVVLMIGGVMWIVAGGSATQIGEAKAWIGASLTGLVLALLSYVILATVNPALVDLKTSSIQTVVPSLYTTIFDSSTACGQEIPGQQRICGSKCPGTQKCEKVPKGTPEARECPITLTSGQSGTSNGDYYLCSSLSSGGTNCCNNNDDSQCPSEYICNMGITTATCTTGACSLKQGDNSGCNETTDCLNGFECSSGRCKATTATQEGVTCNDGNCVAPLKCIFKFFGTYPGVCYDGSKGDPCCYNSNCQSNDCSRPWYSVCAVRNIYDYTCN